jgi:hypothetical protein
MTTAVVMDEAEDHKVKTGTTYGPGGYMTGVQYYGRCSCGWMHVSVTFDSLTPYIHGHLVRVNTP